MTRSRTTIGLALAAALLLTGCSETVKRYSLEVGVSGRGAASPAGRTEHAPGAVVGVAGTPEGGWLLDGWVVTGEGETTGFNPLSVTMDSDRGVMARFVRDDVMVSPSAVGYGTVTPAVGMLHPRGSVVTVAAAPAPGWELVGWDISGEGEWSGFNPISVTLDAPREVVAVFEFSWPEGVPDLAAWLAGNPAVADALVWESPGGAAAFPDWDPCETDELFRAFVSSWDGEPTGLVDPPPPAVEIDDDKYVSRSYWFAADARALWLSYVANGLAVELGGRVPWSVAAYGPAELAILFDSRQMFLRDPDTGHFYVQSSKHGGRATHAPADYAWAFMSDKIGADRVETAGNVIEWCRRMIHYMGRIYAWNAHAHWQYRGYPPTSRIVEGTPRLADEAHDSRADDRIMHRTAGCHGTTGFMRSVLRAANVPVSQVYAGGHSLPHFIADGLYMTHGDDPYNAFNRNETFPGEDILIDSATFEEWFRGGKTAEEQRQSVGRGVRAACVRHAGNYLLGKHRGDVEAGRPHAESEVFESLKRNYTLEELEALRLWERLDERLARD